MQLSSVLEDLIPCSGRFTFKIQVPWSCYDHSALSCLLRKVFPMLSMDSLHPTCWTSLSFYSTRENILCTVISCFRSFLSCLPKYPSPSNYVFCLSFLLFLILPTPNCYLTWQHTLDSKPKNNSCTFYFVRQLLFLNTVPFFPFPPMVNNMPRLMFSHFCIPPNRFAQFRLPFLNKDNTECRECCCY